MDISGRMWGFISRSFGAATNGLVSWLDIPFVDLLLVLTVLALGVKHPELSRVLGWSGWASYINGVVELNKLSSS